MTEPVEVKAEIVAPNTRTTLAVVNDNSPVPRPVVTPEVARKVIVEWEEMKKAIGMESDIRRETRYTKDGPVEVAYYKKSYWRKAATFLAISVEAVAGTENLRVIGEGQGAVKLASVVYVAEKNGRRVVGDGHCGTDEKGKANWTAANLLATAHSRAYNRAVSNFIGGGEVSADEIDEEGLDHKEHAQRPAAPKPQPQAPAPKPQEGDMKVAMGFISRIQQAATKEELAVIGTEIKKLDAATADLCRAEYMDKLNYFKGGK